MSTISTRLLGFRISVTADWSQASDRIIGDISGGYFVSNFRTPMDALRRALQQCADAEGIEPYEASCLIDKAMEKAVEV